MTSYVPISYQRLEEIRQETQKDKSLQVLIKVILQGWPDDTSSVLDLALLYFSHRNELTAHNGIVFRGERVVIPAKLPEVTKQKFQSSHMGTGECLRRARHCMFWPGMSAEMKQLVESCETCRNIDSPQPKETLKGIEIPKRLWKWIGVARVNYYSNFWGIDHLANTRTTTVIT